MTRKEMATVMAVLKTAYPAYYRGQTVEEAKMAVSLWAEMMADYSPEIVAAAVKAFIATGGAFPPSIGQVMELVRKLTEPEEIGDQEAWEIVRKAISNSAYHSREEFEKLPPEIKRVVHTPEQLKVWAIDDSFNEGVVSSNFMRSFRACSKAEKEWAALPDDVKQLAVGAGAGIKRLGEVGKEGDFDGCALLEEHG